MIATVLIALLTLLCVSPAEAGSRCCDGTYSSSQGSGTCSWHGGVCPTSYTPSREPVYTAPTPPTPTPPTPTASTPTVPTASNAKWNTFLVPASPGYTSEIAYLTDKFYMGEDGIYYNAAYKCFNTVDDIVFLTIFNESGPKLKSSLTALWLFAYADDSVTKYSADTLIKRVDGRIIVASTSERVEKDFVRATEVSVVWKEGEKNYYGTWDLKGSKTAVAATKRMCAETERTKAEEAAAERIEAERIKAQLLKLDDSRTDSKETDKHDLDKFKAALWIEPLAFYNNRQNQNQDVPYIGLGLGLYGQAFYLNAGYNYSWNLSYYGDQMIIQGAALSTGVALPFAFKKKYSFQPFFGLKSHFLWIDQPEKYIDESLQIGFEVGFKGSYKRLCAEIGWVPAIQEAYRSRATGYEDTQIDDPYVGIANGMFVKIGLSI